MLFFTFIDNHPTIGQRPLGAALHIFPKLYDVPVGFLPPPPPHFEVVYSFICGCRRVAVARYRMICLALVHSSSLALYNVFLKMFTSKKTQRVLFDDPCQSQGPDPRPLRLLLETPEVFVHSLSSKETASSQRKC